MRESFARLGLDAGVEFLPGFFEESLDALAGRAWSLVRIDADTYEPTRAALTRSTPVSPPGGYVVLDDYGSFEGCRRAVDEFRAEHGIADPIEEIDFTGARWRRRHTKPVAPAAPPAEPAPARRAVERGHARTSRRRPSSSWRASATRSARSSRPPRRGSGCGRGCGAG